MTMNEQRLRPEMGDEFSRSGEGNSTRHAGNGLVGDGVAPAMVPHAPDTARAGIRIGPRAGCFFLCALVLFVVVVRWRYLSMPLERDEGEYAYTGQLILQGVPPYREAYSMKLPGTYLGYALLEACFGQTNTGVRLGLLAVNLVTLGFVFLTGRKLGGMAGGLAAGFAYAVLSQSPGLMANMGHATNFVNVCVAAGVYLFLPGASGLSWKRSFASGVCLGCAILSKQHAAIIVVGFWVGMAFMATRSTQVGWWAVVALIAGSIMPLLAVCAWLSLTGDFASFWFWTIQYAPKYVSYFTLGQAWGILSEVLPWIRSETLVTAIVFLALLPLALGRSRSAAFAVVWIVISILSASPGFLFRQHYFIPVILPVSLGYGLLVHHWIAGAASRNGSSPTLGQIPCGSRRRPNWVPVALSIPIMCVPLLVHAEHMWRLSPSQMTRAQYFGNPFLEIPDLGDVLNRLTAPDERIAFIGSEPQVFFYAKRRSATGYLYAYPLVEDHPFALTMQKQMVAEIEKARPRFIVFEAVPLAWLKRQNAPGYIFSWVDNLADRYKVVAVVELQDSGPAIWIWNPPADFQKTSDRYLVIYRTR